MFLFPALVCRFCVFGYYTAEGRCALRWRFIEPRSGFGICLLSQHETVDFQPVKELEILKQAIAHFLHKWASYLGGLELQENLVFLWDFSGRVFLVSSQVPLAVQFLHHSSEMDSPGWVTLRCITRNNFFSITRLLQMHTEARRPGRFTLRGKKYSLNIHRKYKFY